MKDCNHPEMALLLALERCRAVLEHHLEYADLYGAKKMSRHLHEEAALAARVVADYLTVPPDSDYWNKVRNLPSMFPAKGGER